APRPPRREPLIVPSMQPARLPVRTKALKTPLGSPVVELLPGPFDNDPPARTRKHARDAIEYLRRLSHVMERRRGDHGIDVVDELGPLELHRPIVGPTRR